MLPLLLDDELLDDELDVVDDELDVVDDELDVVDDELLDDDVDKPDDVLDALDALDVLDELLDDELASPLDDAFPVVESPRFVSPSVSSVQACMPTARAAAKEIGVQTVKAR